MPLRCPLSDVRNRNGLGVVSSLLWTGFLVNLGGQGRLDTDFSCFEIATTVVIVRKRNGTGFVETIFVVGSFTLDATVRLDGEGGKGILLSIRRLNGLGSVSVLLFLEFGEANGESDKDKVA